MKAKIIPIVISSLCILGFGNVYAEDYYSSQNASGYYSSQSNSGSHPNNPGYNHHEARRHHENGTKGISISVNMPNYNTYVVNKNNAHFVPPHARHRGPEWINMGYGMPMPQGAVAGGYEHRAELFLCRGNYRGGTHPGKIISGQCHISWGGNEIALSHYQVLTSYARLGWVATRHGNIPVSAIQGGYEHGNPLYICQASYRGGMHPGKVIGGACYISWGGREVAISRYNVLVG